ncbi:MAG: hypothetical protein KGI45_03265 [Patescibacteria group bacterium]|nr:hypothetical protein [Patescibacteria group bacterium]MDE1941261.1 hypothetical protein [Patescibacteria group bacterium]MDE1967062.1 hypothetical protein [Patescibacteria group bacterium]
MDTLIALFGSEAKVKILRLFLFNPSTPFFLKEIASRTQVLPRAVNHELRLLEKADILIKKRQISKEVMQTGKADKITSKKIHGIGYVLNTKFPYLDPLKNLLTITSLQADESLAKRFTNAGRIKLFIASGVFIQNWDSRVDLLVVGDELNLAKIESVIKGIEAEIGKEIAYSAFETQDFEYRYGIHDRLVRDILDYPHVTLLDRLGIEPQ